jgi:hypothetical protein
VKEGGVSNIEVRMQETKKGMKRRKKKEKRKKKNNL